jgi:hypothetical protein
MPSELNNLGLQGLKNVLMAEQLMLSKRNFA